MSDGERPLAVSEPTTDPADVPTMTSALDGAQPVADSSASSAPTSHDPPTTPPAPSTSPIRMWPAVFLRRLLEPPAGANMTLASTDVSPVYPWQVNLRGRMFRRNG